MDNDQPILVPFMGSIIPCETLEDANWLLNFNQENESEGSRA